MGVGVGVERARLAVVENEFSSVTISLDTAGHSPRLHVQDNETGEAPALGDRAGQPVPGQLERTGWAGCASACTGASPNEPRARDHRPGDDADVGHRGYGQFYPGRRGGRRGAGRRRPRAGRRRRAAGGLQPGDPPRPAGRRPGPPRRSAPARRRARRTPAAEAPAVCAGSSGPAGCSARCRRSRCSRPGS